MANPFRRYVLPMSCVELSDDHRAVLTALADRNAVPDGMEDVVEELVRPSGELTGVGHRHAGTRSKGMLG